ncbi:hypothetical protein jhhlp_005764 [Lomentospora prolificans]|uniref:Uncharacterized protein n=1 Tax=Lomentospora prolificans TaxID=41688 RepID=A0A2N3N419_9PEZI|nr:hypothetical protein jhhlp_005764 [Lomentospora prolificans]
MTELLQPQPQTTPKRKRNRLPASSPYADSSFTFELPTRSLPRSVASSESRDQADAEDLSAQSPAAKVVNQFRSLVVLDSGSGDGKPSASSTSSRTGRTSAAKCGGGPPHTGSLPSSGSIFPSPQGAFNKSTSGVDTDDKARTDGGKTPKITDRFEGTPEDNEGDRLVARKRQRLDESFSGMDPSLPSAQPAPGAENSTPTPSILSTERPTNASTIISEPAQVTAVRPEFPANAHRTTPEAEPPKSKKASRKQHKKPKAMPEKEEEEGAAEPEIVEPIRAALTWREEEITVYDPEDKDDDGTGINGVGFQPPPAVARAIALKKRQQLLTYKKMVDGDARAKRNERRRGRDAAIAKESARRRRVRFLSPEDGVVPPG